MAQFRFTPSENETLIDILTNGQAVTGEPPRALALLSVLIALRSEEDRLVIELSDEERAQLVGDLGDTIDHLEQPWLADAEFLLVYLG